MTLRAASLVLCMLAGAGFVPPAAAQERASLAELERASNEARARLRVHQEILREFVLPELPEGVSLSTTLTPSPEGGGQADRRMVAEVSATFRASHPSAIALCRLPRGARYGFFHDGYTILSNADETVWFLAGFKRPHNGEMRYGATTSGGTEAILIHGDGDCAPLP